MGFITTGGDEVARDGRQRLHAEADHQDRRHQGPAAHARQADDEADEQTSRAHAEIDGVGPPDGPADGGAVRHWKRRREQ